MFSLDGAHEGARQQFRPLSVRHGELRAAAAQKRGRRAEHPSLASLRMAVAPTREGEPQFRPCLPQKDPTKQINNKKKCVCVCVWMETL